MSEFENSGQPETDQVVANLQHSFEETLNRQRALWEEASRVAKDESFRFTKLRLSRATNALEKLQSESINPQSMLSGQQEWLRNMVKDYTDQSLRYTEMLRGLAMNAFSAALSSSQKVAQTGQDMARAGVSETERTADTMSQHWQQR